MRCKTFSRLCSAFVAGTLLVSFGAWATPQKPYLAQSFAGAYLAGRIASDDNNIDLAIDYFRQALSYQPGNTLIERNLMLTLLATGQFKDAVQLAAALRNHSDIGHVSRLALAADSFMKRRYAKAKSDIQYKNPDTMDQLISTLLSAWATYGHGNRKNAFKQLEELEGPGWYDLFRNYHLALMYDLSGQKKEAASAFQKAAEDQEGGAAAPDTYERIMMAYASFKFRNQKQQDATAFLKQAEKMLSGRNALHNLRKQIENSQKIARPVSNPDEGAAEAVYNIGTAINRAGGEAYARIYLHIALAMRPGNDATLFQLAELAIKSDRPQQAVTFYQSVAKNSPYFRDADLRLALSLAAAGKTDKAISHLNRLVSLHPDDTQLLVSLANIYMQGAEYASAAKALSRVISQPDMEQRDNWNLFYQCGIAYERLKEWDRAEPNFRKALALYPDQPQILNYLGYSLIDRNMKLDEALDMVRKAAELRPQDGYIVDSLGWAYYKLGRYEEAVKELEKAIRLRPEDATINDHLGNAYWKTGRKLEATFQWNHAIAGNPEAVELARIQKKLQHGLKEGKTLADKAGQDG